MTCPAGTTYEVTFLCPNPIPTPGPPRPCSVGDPVACADGSMCAGDSCCRDGSTCPSAHEEFSGCASPKASDCLGPSPTPVPPSPAPTPPSPPSPVPTPPAPTPGTACNVGDPVACPDGVSMCAGDSCCPGALALPQIMLLPAALNLKPRIAQRKFPWPSFDFGASVLRGRVAFICSCSSSS